MLLAILALAAIYRTHFLDVPLDRDEGEYAYAGRLLREGVPPYRAAYNMKMPGTYAAYAGALTLFGESDRGIRIALLLVSAATTVLVALLARRFFGPVAGLAAGAAFALLALGTPLRGIFAKAEHFVLLPAVAGLLVLMASTARERARALPLLASGLLLGLAFVMKQHGALFAALGGAVLLVLEAGRRPREPRGAAVRLGAFAAGAVLPLAVTAGLLARAGVFEKFRFWTFTYAAEYASSVPLGKGLGILGERLGELGRAYFPIVALAALGLGILLVQRRRERATGVTLALLGFSFLAVCPGLYFRAHYFLLLVPAVSILAGVGFAAAFEAGRGGRRGSLRLCGGVVVAALIAVGVVAQTAVRERHVLAAREPGRVARLVYAANPFPESPVIARYLREHTRPDETIAVVGSEPQIYFYSERRGATGYLYTYALVERQPHAHAMQEEMIREIEGGHPRYLVFVNLPESWLVQRDSDTTIFEWFRRFAEANCELVGIVEIREGAETIYRWDAEAKGYAPQSPTWITIFRRKE